MMKLASQALTLAIICIALAACSRAPDAGDDVAENPATEPAINTVWIPMEDGVRLAADIYMPTNAEPDERYPVLLEYLPYRKDEGRARGYSLYRYFQDRGYAVARVDIRGTGNSEGVTIPYEYSDIELDDGEIVIDWLSRQDWSSGSVGMFGISWGGFNSIQSLSRESITRPRRGAAYNVARSTRIELPFDKSKLTFDNRWECDRFTMFLASWTSSIGSSNIEITEHRDGSRASNNG